MQNRTDASNQIADDLRSVLADNPTPSSNAVRLGTCHHKSSQNSGNYDSLLNHSENDVFLAYSATELR